MPSQTNHSINKIRRQTENPELVEKLLTNAKFYFEQGSHHQAAEAYQEILKIDAGNKDAIAGLKNATQPDRDSITVNWKLMILLFTGIIIVAGIILWQSGALTTKDSLSTGSSSMEKTNGNNPSTLNLEESLPRTLSEIKDETEQSRRSAETSQANIFAPDIFRAAIETEQAADQALNVSNYTAAESLFLAADEGYRRAMEVASSSINDLRESAKAARENTLRARAAALDNDADIAPSFRKAVDQLETGNQALEKGEFGKARSAFFISENLFRQAKAEAAKVRTEVKALKQLMVEASAAEQKAILARQNLETEDVMSYAEAAYDFAIQKENEGRQLIANQNYEAAILAFNEAVNAYQRTVEEKNGIESARKFYQTGEYEKSLKKLNAVLSGAPYQGKNKGAHKLLSEVEAAKAARDEQISRAMGAAETGDLKSAYLILKNLPQRQTSIVKERIQEILAMDTKPPEIIYQPEKYYKPKEPFHINVTVRDNIQVKEVRLFYKRKNESDYEAIIKQFNGQDEYRFSVAPDDHKRGEIYYFFSATDISGKEIRYDEGGKPFRIKVAEVNIAVP